MVVIGIVTGQFDIIHPGYISLFKFAKANCDSLHVLLNTCPENKEPPIFKWIERDKILSALVMVDKIQCYTSEKALYALLRQYRYNFGPHNLTRFLGEEYIKKDFTGKELDISVMYHPNKNQWHYTEVLKKAHEKFLRIKK